MGFVLLTKQFMKKKKLKMREWLGLECSKEKNISNNEDFNEFSLNDIPHPDTDLDHKSLSALMKDTKSFAIQNENTFCSGDTESFGIKDPDTFDNNVNVKSDIENSVNEVIPPIDEQKSLNVVILGTPNAGKSVFTNKMISEKVSAVSSKRNTTRSEIRGIMTIENAQIILYDTPGIIDFEGSKHFYKRMSRTAWTAAHNADIGLVIIDLVKRLGEAERNMLKRAKEVCEKTNIPLVLVLNKIDLAEGKKYDKMIKMKTQEVVKYCKFSHRFMCSALFGQGVDTIQKFLIEKAIKRKWFYLPSRKTNLNQKQRVVEVLREKIFSRLNEEFPYMVEQSTDKWVLRKDGSLYIAQRLYVKRKFQMGILIGRKGRLIERIKDCAQEDLQDIFNCKVDLVLTVSHRRKNYQLPSNIA